MVIEAVPSLFGFFRDAVGAASARRRAIDEPATVDYLAQLLVTFATGENTAVLDRSIILTLDEALAATPGEQLLGLQAVGDGALYTVSFFPEHLARAHLDPGLYVHVGAFAYGRAAELLRASGTREPRVLVELTNRFPAIVDVLGEVAQSAALGTVTRDLVRLFDRWKATGSTHALDAMARAGAFPAKGAHRC
jgi:hypothetical protein